MMITMVSTTLSSDSMAVMEPIHLTMTTMVFLTSTTGMMTMTVFSKDQSITLRLRLRALILEMFQPIASLLQQQNTHGLQHLHKSEHSILLTNTHSTTITTALPMRTTMVQEQAVTTKMMTTMDESTNLHGLVIMIQMESWITSTLTMTTITLQTLTTPTHMMLQSQPAMLQQVISSMHLWFGTLSITETTLVA